MNLFEDQLFQREKSDNASFEDAIDSIANAVMGSRLRNSLRDDEVAASAIDRILKYYRCTPSENLSQQHFGSIEEQLEYSMRPFGIKSRSVILEKGWYHHAIGAMLGTLKEDGAAVALIPDKVSGYILIDVKNGKQKKLNRKTEQLIDREATCFYEPLPQRALSVGDLFRFMMSQLNISDIVVYLLLLAASAALGLLSPMFTKWLFNDVLQSGSIRVLIALAVFMLCFSVSTFCLNSFQGLLSSTLGIKRDIAVEAAVMNRIISLPPSFFKDYSSGELAQRSAYVQNLCSTLFTSIENTGFTSLFSLIYIAQIFAFAPSLGVPSLVIILATLALSLLTTFVQMKITRECMDISTKNSGLTYAAITGIQKIKLAGAEKRMFSRWAKQYAKEAELSYDPPTFLKLSNTLGLALSLAGTVVLYSTAIKNNIPVADYYAFNTAYAMVSSALMSVVTIAASIAAIKPALEMAKPILEAVPEYQEGKELITKLRGRIELTNVSFRYDESMPNVIDNLSLRISPGEYVAIVGSTGCGKSTLIRLLLGFETPQKGMISFDNKDITKLDLESLRKKIGVVMQDGKLFIGDIYSNIVITAPQLGLDAAWEAAEIACIADDIREMPMGMHTIISEGQGGISGGQKQRLMIARAVAPKPRVLILDEATSALDNITQKQISDAIDSLKCTRIVIAHRLSTVRHADRIVFLDKGKIVEEGTYEELIEKNGYFAELIKRQRIDIDAP